MTPGRTLTDADVDAIARALADRLDARLRRARPTGKRRTKDPELAAQLAREVAGPVPAPVDELARARARRALDRMRAR